MKILTFRDLLNFVTENNVPLDTQIVLSNDHEGNSFDTMYCGEVMNYDVQNNEVHLFELTQYLENIGFTKKDIKPGTRSIVLWP